MRDPDNVIGSALIFGALLFALLIAAEVFGRL